MKVTREISAYILWSKNLREKKIPIAKDPKKRQSFVFKFKSSLEEMSKILLRLEDLNPTSMIEVIDAGIDALRSQYLKSQALESTGRYLECWGGFSKRKDREGVTYMALMKLRQRQHENTKTMFWRKIKVFEINYRKSKNLQVVFDYGAGYGVQSMYVAKTSVDKNIKKMFLSQEEMALCGHADKATKEEIDLIIKKMGLLNIERTKQMALMFKRKFQADCAALKLYAIAEAIVLNNDVEAAKMILSAKIIDQLPLTPNAKNYFALRAKHKVADAWKGLKCDYPTLKSIEEIEHPENLVPRKSENTMRKYFIQNYLEDKFDEELYKRVTKYGEYNDERIANIDSLEL